MLTLSQADTGTLLTLAEAKAQCRVNTNDDDDFIQDLIDEAVDYIEQDTGISFWGSTWVETFDHFHDHLILERYPVASVSLIQYYTNPGNTLTTLNTSLYIVRKPTFSQGKIERVMYATLPVTYPREDAWQVTYVTGLTPPPIAKRAAKILVENWYANRGANPPAGSIGQEALFGVSNLLRKLDKRGL